MWHAQADFAVWEPDILVQEQKWYLDGIAEEILLKRNYNNVRNDMEKKNWIKGAIKKKGALRKELDIKPGKKIPVKKLDAAAKKGGKEGQRARLAKTLSKLRKK